MESIIYAETLVRFTHKFFAYTKGFTFYFRNLDSGVPANHSIYNSLLHSLEKRDSLD